MSILGRLFKREPIEHVSPRDALEACHAREMLIVDVREPTEWKQTGTPAGSYRVALSDPNFVSQVEAISLDHPDAVVAISCKSGMRSKSAVKMLRKANMNTLKVVEGGMDRWNAESLPVDG